MSGRKMSGLVKRLDISQDLVAKVRIFFVPVKVECPLQSLDNESL